MHLSLAELAPLGFPPSRVAFPRLCFHVDVGVYGRDLDRPRGRSNGAIVYDDVCLHLCVVTLCVSRMLVLSIGTNGDDDDGGGVLSDPGCGLDRDVDAFPCHSCRAVSPDPPPRTFQNPPESC